MNEAELMAAEAALGEVEEAEDTGTLEDCARTINFLKREALMSNLDYAARIGAELVEAKRKCPHGEWYNWLNEYVNYSPRTATRLMQVYEKRGALNRTPVADLELSKLALLAALPESEIPDFVSNVHDVNGEEKSVTDMTRRELEQVIRERDEARAQAGEERNRADGLKLKLDNAQANAEKAEAAKKAAEIELDDAKKDVENTHKAYATVNRLVDEHIAEEKRLRAELAELRARPVDVAVEAVPDQAAIDRARAEALAEAEEAHRGDTEKIRELEHSVAVADLRSKINALYGVWVKSFSDMAAVLDKIKGTDKIAAENICEKLRSALDGMREEVA